MYSFNLTKFRKTTVLAVVFSTILILPLTATASGESSARALGMGGAFSALASGVNAARFNPANLGFADYQDNGIEFIGFGANFSNNAFTLDDYNDYNGSTWTDQDKADILTKIPDGGLTFRGNLNASAFSVALGSFVLSNEVSVNAYVNLNKDIIDLALNGNTFADTISFEGSYSEVLAYGSTSLSYGRPIYSNGTREVAIGASVKYIKGLGIEEVIEMDGAIATLNTGFEGQGRLIAKTSTGGSGFGLDLGASIKLDNSMAAGISIKNFLSSITWNKNNEEHGYIFNFDTLTIDNSSGDFFVSDDYSVPTGEFKSSLPSVMVVGLAKTSGKLLWAIDWEQGFKLSSGSSTKPRISAGIEWNKFSVLPLRTGFSTGGGKNTAFSFGSSLKLSLFYVDFAVVTGSSFSAGSTKGLNFAVASGINF